MGQITEAQRGREASPGLEGRSRDLTSRPVSLTPSTASWSQGRLDHMPIRINPGPGAHRGRWTHCLPYGHLIQALLNTSSAWLGL